MKIQKKMREFERFRIFDSRGLNWIKLEKKSPLNSESKKYYLEIVNAFKKNVSSFLTTLLFI